MGVSIPLLPQTATVGREAERALLSESLARAAAGAAHAVLLIGDAGIGKTRLLAEIAATAMRRNALVLRGRGTEIVGLPPYLLFLEALRPFIASAAGRALHRRLGRRAAAAGELFPELAKPGRTGSLPPEEARLRLFEAVGELIDAAAAGQAVVLILDDLHWADAASLDLLGHLFCHRGLHRVLCVGASRAAEAEGNAALGRTLDRLNHDRLLTPLRLLPLSAEHIATLAADRLGGVVGGSLPDALYRHSEGNPFFAEELLRCWHEGGGIASRDGVWDLTGAFAPGDIPAGIAGAVRERLAWLTSDVVRRLQIASLVGRSFEPELIAAVATLPVEAVEALKISLRIFIRLLEVSAKAAKIDNFGLRLSERRLLSNLGPVGLMVREQPTVRKAIQALARYIGLHSDGISLRIDERDGLVVINPAVFTRRSVPMRQATELSVGVAFRILRISLGEAWKPDVVLFSHAPPKNRDIHLKVLGPRIKFGQNFNAIVCRARDLERPIPASDPVMARYIQQYLDLIGGRPNVTASDKVRDFVWMLLPAGRCSIENVAGHMGVDRRTVHRRLGQEGTSFSSIVEGVRTEMVARYFEDPNRPLYLIAQMLGFSALSAFSRWFRDRYGSSPSQWRVEAFEMSEPSGEARR